MTVPDLNLDELEALEKAATPGEWLQATHVDEPRALCAARSMKTSLLGLDVDGMAIVQEEADAALIVALRNAAPALLAAARRLIELESALEYLRTRYSMMGTPEAFLDRARELGWSPPNGAK